MAKYIIITDFSRIKNSDFVEKVDFILENMTGNANFPEPTPTLAEITTSVAALRAAVTKAEKGMSMDKTNRDDLRADLNNKMKALGHDVMSNAANDLIKIQSSGFDLKKESIRRGVLDKPQNLEANPSKKLGAVEVKCHAVDGARVYQFKYTEFPVITNLIPQRGCVKSPTPQNIIWSILSGS